jgi:hypothetical protein
VASLPPGLVVAVIVLGIAAHRRETEPDPRLRWALLLPGSLLVGFVSGLATDPPGVPIVAVVAAALSGLAVTRFDRRWGPVGMSPVVLVVSAGGLFYTLPDPEEAAILMGVALPLVLLGVPRLRREYGIPGSWVVAGLFVWTVLAGGYGRDSAVIGGIACLGAFIASPIAERLRPRPGRARRGVALITVHAATVLTAARVAGLQQSGIVALAMAVPLIALATGALLLIHHSGRLRSNARDDSPHETPLARRQQPRPHEDEVEREGDGHHGRADD